MDHEEQKERETFASRSVWQSYSLFLPTVTGLLRRRQSVTGINVDNSRIIHFPAARAYFNISSWTLVVSAGFNRFCHSVYLLPLKIHVLYHIYG